MSTRIRFCTTFLFLCLAAGLCGQSFPGLAFDNYAGINGLLLNPANAAANRVGFELHAASVSAGVANDYIGIGSYKAAGEIDWDSDLLRNPRADNSLHVNADLLGPSLLLGLGKRAGLGLITRVRTVYDVENIDGRLFEGLQNEFGTASFASEMTDHRSVLHGWGEVGVVLGVSVLDNQFFTLKVGGAAKRLLGVGAVYTQSDRLRADYDAGAETLTTAGDFTYGRTGEFYFEDLDLEDLPGYYKDPAGTGTAFDLGATFEWRPGGIPDTVTWTPYRLKVGVSLTDLGRIDYTGGERTRFAADNTLDRAAVEGQSLEGVLYGYYDGTTTDGARSVRLPTALHLMADLRLAGKLYVTALSTTAFATDDAEGMGNRARTTLLVAPRLETKLLSLYVPARFGGTEGTTVGAGLRFWLLTVGSNSLLSHLFTDTNYAADVYVGAKLPFYRASKPGGKNKTLPTAR